MALVEGTERRRLQLVLLLAAGAQLVMGFTNTATSIAFPEIEQSLGAPRTTLAWGVTGFAIVQASLMLICGRLGDRIGRRTAFEWGMAIFVIGSLGTAAAPSGALFVATRLVQGVGAAAVVPTGLALALQEFPASRRVAVAAMTTAIFAAGQAATPLIAAGLTQLGSWRLIYVWPAIMCTAIGLSARHAFSESPRTTNEGRIDVTGVVFGTLAIAALAYAITEGPRTGWMTPEVVGSLVASVVLLWLCVVRCLRHPQPLFDVRLLRIRSVWSASATTVLSSVVSNGIWLAWPLMLTQGLGYSVLETGLLLTPVPAVMALGAWGAGALANRVGARGVVLIGSSTWIVALGLLVVQMGTTPSYVGELLPGFLVSGFGFGMTVSPLQGLALRDVEPRVFGQVSAIVLTFRFVGAALGAALAIGLIGDVVPPPMTHFQDVHVVFLVLAILAGLVALVLPGHRRETDHEAPSDTAVANAAS